jgi:DNA replication protein DnaC
MRFERQGMGYTAIDDQSGVELRVDHLSRSRGEVHGELSVTCALVKRGHVHRARFNLSSSSARTQLGKLLTTRTEPHRIPWTEILEDFCTNVLDAHRNFRDVQRVGNLPLRAISNAYRVSPLLPIGKTTILFGAGGTGKSYLATAVAVATATGRSLLGWHVERANVLYLDWETDAYEIDERIKRVAAGMGVRSPDILYRNCAGSFEDMAEDVARFVDENEVGLVVIDSIGMASSSSGDGGDANESTIRLFTALRYIGTTILAIDHVTGADLGVERAVHKPYGSVYKVNLARSVYELRRAIEATDDAAAHLALYHRKVNSGPLQKVVGIRAEHTDTTVSFGIEEVVANELEAGLTISARLQRLLRTGPMLDTELAEETGDSLTSIRSKLSTYSRGLHPMFVKLPDKRWALRADNTVITVIRDGDNEGLPLKGESTHPLSRGVTGVAS